MSLTTDSSTEEGIGPWAWLFPATYVIHILEEYFGGEGFAAWSARTSGAALPISHFIILTSLGGVLMTIGIYWTLRARYMRWLPITLSGVFLINSLSHLLNTIFTKSYSPGLISGLVIWVPLALFALARMRGLTSRRTYWLSLVIGAGIHAIVSLLARFSGIIFGG